VKQKYINKLLDISVTYSAGLQCLCLRWVCVATAQMRLISMRHVTHDYDYLIIHVWTHNPTPCGISLNVMKGLLLYTHLLNSPFFPRAVMPHTTPMDTINYTSQFNDTVISSEARLKNC